MTASLICFPLCCCYLCTRHRAKWSSRFCYEIIKSLMPWLMLFFFFPYLWKQQEDFQTWRNLFSFQKHYLQMVLYKCWYCKSYNKTVCFSDNFSNSTIWFCSFPLSTDFTESNEFLWYNSHWQPNEPFLLIIHMNWMWAFHLTLRFFCSSLKSFLF